MSDKPQGPGWWLASDGTWHPPELHPSMQAEAAEVMEAAEAAGTTRVEHVTKTSGPVPVPELEEKPSWRGEPDHRPEAGPMYPDLFAQAVAGTSLADVVQMHGTDGGGRQPLPASLGADDDELVLAGASRTPAEIGAFTGASAKRRWRLHR